MTGNSKESRVLTDGDARLKPGEYSTDSQYDTHATRMYVCTVGYSAYGKQCHEDASYKM
jgi:hypothetical protein